MGLETRSESQSESKPSRSRSSTSGPNCSSWPSPDTPDAKPILTFMLAVRAELGHRALDVLQVDELAQVHARLLGAARQEEVLLLIEAVQVHLAVRVERGQRHLV